MQPMSPQHDRARTSPATITDFDSTARVQGMGFHVVRIETVQGSAKAHITWRQMPDAHDQRAVEEHLTAMYERVSHGV